MQIPQFLNIKRTEKFDLDISAWRGIVAVCYNVKSRKMSNSDNKDRFATPVDVLKVMTVAAWAPVKSRFYLWECKNGTIPINKIQVVTTDKANIIAYKSELL